MLDNAHIRGNRIVMALVLGAGSWSAPALRGQVGLGLSPMRLEHRLAAGGTHSGPLDLTNESPGKVRVRSELLDFYLDATGTPQFGRSYPQEAEFSCRQWLTLNPMEAEIPPESHLVVRYTLHVPPAATPGRSYHCAVGISTLPPAASAGMGIRTAVRVVAAFYVILGNPAIEGQVTNLQAQYVPDPKQPGWRAVVTIKNWSYMHFRPTGELQLLDAAGAVIEQTAFQPLPVLPQREQQFLFPLKAPVQGNRYTLRARVDIGTNEIQEATAAFDTGSSRP